MTVGDWHKLLFWLWDETKYPTRRQKIMKTKASESRKLAAINSLAKRMMARRTEQSAKELGKTKD